MPKIACTALCRGEGQGYVLLNIEGSFEGVCARAHTRSGKSVPCELRVFSEKLLEKRTELVLIVPLLALDLSLELFLSARPEGEPAWRGSFSAQGSKLRSRLTSVRAPELAASLRGIEKRICAGHTQLQVTEIWPAGTDELVWRVSASFPVNDAAAPGATPIIRALDKHGNPVALSSIIMEDQLVTSPRDPELTERLVSFSLRVPASLKHLCLIASLNGSEAARGFCCLLPYQVDGLLREARRRIGGASWDARYPLWFEAHCASDAELASQRQRASQLSSAAPLISIVMPVFKPDPTHFAEAIASVCCQTYPRWELIVVNASGASPELEQALHMCAQEPRIRLMNVPNRSISENTNAGVAQAQGDYLAFLDHDDLLEPDALWCYAHEVMADKTIDLLYCDEDRLSVEGKLGMPAFKPGPNMGKLLAYNYVTHLLCVSRRILDKTERSGPEVSGAQDYDLTLKAFEQACSIKHVPRVLYHWRESPNSTASNAASKPYAHEAGQRALAAHLKRRNIAASVEDGLLPFSYRLRYQLSEPAPLVSIIIPTHDHADLLERCVRSIFSRSSYPRFELILVENSSVEAATFALYEHLEQEYANLRVVRWEPPKGQDTGFNYSALVNFGAREAQGELLVFLNNDTEVIEASWLEEMAGCLMRPEVGIVGAKLLFGDGLVQHVGMSANPNCDFFHMSQNFAADELGPGYSAGMCCDLSMVTGACQMMSRKLFDELGGYDEGLAVGFNDGDICLRARELGKVVAFTPYALLHHREFSSRGREKSDTSLQARYLQERSRFIARHAKFLAEGDPALNPNLDGFSPWSELPRH